MAIAMYLLPALALANAVAAQCSAAITTITATSQNIPCSTYSGSIAIATELAGTVSIDGIQSITGNLSAQGNTGLTGIEANDLQSTGGIALGNLTTLSSISMPELTNVGALNFSALPELQMLSFGTGIQKATSLLITNTQLTTLNGINLTTVDTFNVNNNGALTTIEVQLTAVSGPLDIEANGFGHNITASFPNLVTAQNMTFRNCSSVSLPSLANVTNELGFYGNLFDTFSAPNLTTAGGIVFDDNVQLTNISLPMLTSINGTYQIANNTLLTNINGFQKLSVVKSNIDFSGNFTNVTLPSLTQVSGGFNLQTSGQFNDCPTFQTYKTNQVIKGTFTCQGSESKVGTLSSSASGTSSGSSAKKTGAAGHVEVNYPAVLGGTSLFAGLLQLVL